ncbi:UNVERIFIED_CONTAM: hypothetical protein Sradi_2985900, partial [Sesamum radiatum]
DTCFKLHGVPEWYKDLNEQKKKGSVNRAFASTETQSTLNRFNSQGDYLVFDLLEALKTIQSNKMQRDLVQVHFAQDMEIAAWHKRLGHPSPLVLTHISELNIAEYNKSYICPVCPLAKQSRKSFPSYVHHAAHPFDLIHIDIWGPYKQPSLSECHYVLTIIDDHSR